MSSTAITEQSVNTEDDISGMYNAIDEILRSNTDIKTNIDDMFSCIDEQIQKAEGGCQYLTVFNGQMDSCLKKMKTTLGKWIFIPNNKDKEDNSDSNDISIIDVPSNSAPLGKVATKKVSHRHFGRFHLASRSRQVTHDSSGEVIPVKKVMPAAPRLPPIGARVIKPPLQPGLQVYAMTTSITGKWNIGYVLEILEDKSNERKYKVRIDKRSPSKKFVKKPVGKPIFRVLSGKALAYTQRPNVILPVGTRVISKYREEPCNDAPVLKQRYYDSLYAGIIAEPPKSMNNFKYLIFFDDGYAQYSPIQEVCLVCESSKCVWEDVHEQAQHFVKEYMNQYPERPMVKLQRGQSVRTEYKGEWLNTKVIAVNGSLAKVIFELDGRTEWVYRGSTRLGPLFNKFQKKEEHSSGRVRRQGLASAFNSQKLPYVEYTFSNDDKIEDTEKSSGEEQQAISRNVARKSSSKLAKPFPNDRDKEASVENGTIERNLVNIPTLPSYKLHKRCSTACLKLHQNHNEYMGTNLLEVPTYCGWRREVVKDRPGRKKLVYYRGPCGRRLRSIEEVQRYLKVTNSPLSIDMFCFDSYVQTFQTYVPGNCFMKIDDITYGKENLPIPCINTLDNEKPTYLEYSKVRMPCKGVPLNLDTHFLSCCDCEDNCMDSTKCSCQQLSIESTKLVTGEADPNAHYVYRRLTDQIFTGLYECNENCKCDKRCMNRLAQNGLRQRLQLFKTAEKGWGLRILDDLPKGSFICVYTGQLLTEQAANADGRKYGDEYMAELDYIETVENQIKDGYESDIPQSEKSELLSEPDDGACTDSDSSFSENLRDGGPDHNPDNSSKMLTRKLSKSVSEENSEEQGSGVIKEEVTGDKDVEVTGDKDVEVTGDKDEEVTGDKDEELPDLDDDFNSIDLPSSHISVRPVSPETAEKLESHKITRRPRLKNIEIENSISGSDSEEDAKVESCQSGKSYSESKGQSAISVYAVDEDDSALIRTPQVKHFTPFKRSSSSISPEKMSSLNQDAEFKVSARSYFGDEYCYVMDAKNAGNIGRYLNHSCSPNVFVQNIFVDTHDLRFPWVAFFAGQNIKAGEELTWDYNYEIGSVKDRELYCYCNSANCRGRLL